MSNTDPIINRVNSGAREGLAVQTSVMLKTNSRDMQTNRNNIN